MSKEKAPKNAFELLMDEEIMVFLKSTKVFQIQNLNEVIEGQALRGYMVGYDDNFILLATQLNETFNVMVSIDEIGVISIVTGMADVSDLQDYNGEDTH